LRYRPAPPSPLWDGRSVRPDPPSPNHNKPAAPRNGPWFPIDAIGTCCRSNSPKAQAIDELVVCHRKIAQERGASIQCWSQVWRVVQEMNCVIQAARAVRAEGKAADAARRDRSEGPANASVAANASRPDQQGPKARSNPAVGSKPRSASRPVTRIVTDNQDGLMIGSMIPSTSA